MNASNNMPAPTEHEQALSLGALRPFASWTIAYVRALLRTGRISDYEAAVFAAQFGGGCTLAELREGGAR